MKKILLICLIALTSINAGEYLISKDGLNESGGYGGFAYQAMQVDGKTTVLAGGGGSWVINDQFHMGFSGYSNASERIQKGKDRFSYGTINLGWSSNMPTVYSPYVFLSLGSGNMSNKTQDTEDQFSAIGLNAGVQLKVTQWFRIVPFVGYTIISFNNNDHYENSDFGGLNYGMQFNFGSWK